MDVTAQSPFVNGAMLKSFGQRRVRVVGKVVRDANGFQLETSDQVTIDVSGSNAVPGTDFAEVEGTVTGERSIAAESVTDFGNQFDLANYDAMVALANSDKYAPIFRS